MVDLWRTYKIYFLITVLVVVKDSKKVVVNSTLCRALVSALLYYHQKAVCDGKIFRWQNDEFIFKGSYAKDSV